MIVTGYLCLVQHYLDESGNFRGIIDLDRSPQWTADVTDVEFTGGVIMLEREFAL